MALPLDKESAETIALHALAYIVSDEPARDTLLNQTGLDVADLRAQASDAAFLGNVLDFLTRHEDLLLAFEVESGHRPEQVMRALRVLAPEAERSI